MLRSTVIVLTSLMLCAYVAADQCGSGELMCNDATMGPTCYDPNTYTCPSGSRGTILCGNQEHGPDGACGLICYDMTMYQCCNEQLYDITNPVPCPSVTSAPTSPPTSSPTSPPVGTAPTDSQATCGTSECAAGLSCCDDIRMGPTCYDPNTYTCPTGSQGTILCGNQEHGPDGACGTICYDMVEYQCCNDQLYQAGQDTPCSQTNPTQSPTSAPVTSSPTSSPVGSAPTDSQATCGANECAAGLSCCDDVRMGPTCYDPNTYTCPTGSQGPILCGNQEHGPDGACGTICYDMVEYQCCNDQLYQAGQFTPCSQTNPTQPATSSPTQFPGDTHGSTSPPVGTAPTDSQPMCGNYECAAGLSCCDDVRMGPTCYDPSTYTCPTGSQGTILCGNQEHGPDGACGLICYDMVDYQCCNDQLYGSYQQTPCSQTTQTGQPTPGTSAPTTGLTQAPTQPPAPTQPTSQPGGSCGSTQCADGNMCCDDVNLGPTCYDPSTYTCPTGSVGPILCGNQEHGPDGACGSVCYDMVDYKCCNDQLYGVNDAYVPC